MEWFVPEFDEALIPQHRLVTIELVWAGAGYKYQVTPFTKGDVELANRVADAMNKTQEKSKEE